MTRLRMLPRALLASIHVPTALRPHTALVLLGFLVTVGCSGETANQPLAPGSDDAITLSDLVGTWDIAKWEYVSVAAPVVRDDFIASRGGRGTWDTEPDASCSIRVCVPGFEPMVDNGTLEVSEGLVVAHLKGGFTITFAANLSAGRLTLTSVDTIRWDFGRGAEDARVSVVLEPADLGDSINDLVGEWTLITVDGQPVPAVVDQGQTDEDPPRSFSQWFDDGTMTLRTDRTWSMWVTMRTVFSDGEVSPGGSMGREGTFRRRGNSIEWYHGCWVWAGSLLGGTLTIQEPHGELGFQR